MWMFAHNSYLSFAMDDLSSLRAEVLAKLQADKMARLQEPAMAELNIDEGFQWAKHCDPFCNQLIQYCGRHDLKASFGNARFAKWNSSKEQYDFFERQLIRIQDFELGYQLDCTPIEDNSIIKIIFIRTIGSTEDKAMAGKGFYACRRFLMKLKKVFFQYGWPQGVVKDGLVKCLLGTVKGATQLATHSKSKITSVRINKEEDWRASTESKWSELVRFRGQNRLCIFWRLMGFAYLSDDEAGYPQLTLINEESLHQLEEETAADLEQRLHEQQQLIHFRDYETAKIHGKSSSEHDPI